jgi:hypothetical protein
VRKLRRAMVDPEREPLAGLVEVDESSIPFRAKDEPARPGRSHDGKLLVAGAVEIKGKGPGRARLAVIADYSATALGAFVAGNVAGGSTVVSDGWSGYARLKDVEHDPRVIGDAPAHAVLPWVHRVFANAKRWAMGVCHGLRPAHLQAYLDEFVFRFNRRRSPHAAFDRLLGLSLALEPATYQMLVRRAISSTAHAVTRSFRCASRRTRCASVHTSLPISDADMKRLSFRAAAGRQVGSGSATVLKQALRATRTSSALDDKFVLLLSIRNSI